MKTFKSFIAEEKPNFKPKAKGEADFVATHTIDVRDDDDEGTKEYGAEKSAKDIKSSQGKRKADRTDNKQSMGEGWGKKMKKEESDDSCDTSEKGEKKTYRGMKKDMKEATLTKQQTKMAHTIGKEFEKKGVGDESKGGPYAVATAMVTDKPEAAKKAYNTIKAKMKEESEVEILFKLYEELNEDNQMFFMSKLEESPESLLEFALSQVGE